MVSNILSLPEGILANIIDFLRLYPPGYRCRTLHCYVNLPDGYLKKSSRQILNIMSSCKKFYQLLEPLLYEHFTPSTLWPGYCPADSVDGSRPIPTDHGIRHARYLYLEMPQNNAGRDFTILHATTHLKRLHLGIIMGVLNAEVLADGLSQLHYLDTVTMAFLTEPGESFTVKTAIMFYKAVAIVPRLRALSLNTTVGTLDQSHGLRYIPLGELEICDIQKPSTYEVRQILQQWNLKALKILALKNCYIPEDSLEGVQLPELHVFRLHSGHSARVLDCKHLADCKYLKRISFDSMFILMLMQRIAELPPQIEIIGLLEPASTSIQPILNLLVTSSRICPNLRKIQCYTSRLSFGDGSEDDSIDPGHGAAELVRSEFPLRPISTGSRSFSQMYRVGQGNEMICIGSSS